MDEPGTYRIDVIVKAKVVKSLDRDGFTRRQVIREATALHESGEADIATVERFRPGLNGWRAIYSAGSISRA